MADFRRDNRSSETGRGNRSSSGPKRFERRGGRSESRDRAFTPRDRNSRSEGRSLEMFNVTCDKCGKPCKVPFRPSGSKPVFCSDCFRKEEGNSSFSPRSNNQASSGMSPEQFKQINAKLDKIMQALEIE